MNSRKSSRKSKQEEVRRVKPKPSTSKASSEPSSSSSLSAGASRVSKESPKAKKRRPRAQKNPEDEPRKESLVKRNDCERPTKAIGIDCEMVGVDDRGCRSILARVSLVNQFGHCLYDKYVKPIETVTDYRTFVSGIRPENLENGEDFKIVQKEVYDIIKGRILVGHAISNDLKVLYLDHPRAKIRDTSVYFRKIINCGKPSLKRLTSQLLNVDIQTGEHDSVQDARAAMRLYTMYKKKWESELDAPRRKMRNKKRPAS